MKRPPISLTEKLALKFLSVICISHKNQQYLWILKIRFLVMLQAYFFFQGGTIKCCIRKKYKCTDYELL